MDVDEVEAIVTPAPGEASRRFGAAVERFSRMIEAVPEPDTIAIGHWSVRDVAAHVSHIIGMDLDAAAGRPIPVWESVADIDAHTDEWVVADAEHDMGVLAQRLRDRAQAFRHLVTQRAPDEKVTWAAGAEVTRTTLLCHSLGDVMIHELDVARAIGRDWSVLPADALMAIYGCLVPLAGAVDFADLIGDESLGRSACIDLRIRGGSPLYFVLDDGSFSIEGPSARPVDLHVNADPVALVLQLFEREPRWRPIVTGRMVAWGAHPIRAVGFLNRVARALP